MLTIILEYGFKETLVCLQLQKITQFYFNHTFTISVHLHSCNFSIDRMKNMIMNIISQIKYKNSQALSGLYHWWHLKFCFVCFHSKKEKRKKIKKYTGSRFDVIKLRYLDCGTSLKFVCISLAPEDYT